MITIIKKEVAGATTLYKSILLQENPFFLNVYWTNSNFYTEKIKLENTLSLRWLEKLN